MQDSFDCELRIIIITCDHTPFVQARVLAIANMLARLLDLTLV